MKASVLRYLFALTLAAGTLALILALLQAPAARSATVILDGLPDPAYGPALAADPPGDLASPGPRDWPGTHWTDVISLYVTNDSRNLYVFVPLPAYTRTASSGSFGLVIATGQYTTTDSTPPRDPWYNSISFAYTATHANVGETPVPLPYSIIPDAVVRGNIVGSGEGGDDNGWTELRRWNGTDYSTGAGTNWGGASPDRMIGDHVAFADGVGVEFAIPFADLGIPYAPGLPIHLQFYATQTDDEKGAFDTVPSDDQSTGWNYTTTQRFLATFVLAPAPTLDVIQPPDGAFFAHPDITVTGSVSPVVGVTVTVDLNGTALYTPALDADGRFTRPVTLARGANTLTVTARSETDAAVVVRRVTFGAAHDDDVFWDGLLHNSRDPLYRTPVGPVPAGTPVTLRLRAYAGDLTAHGYNVLFNLDELTASDLNTDVVKLLILNAYGPNPLTDTETQAVADFVASGGSLWLGGMSDYTGKVWWAYDVADRMNGLIAAVESRVGVTVPIRFNDDEVLDGDDNNGYPWGIQWHVFPVSPTTGVGVNVLQIQSWSVASLVDRNRQALTAEDLGANGHLFVVGDLDEGSGTYGYPNRTSNTDADNEGDAYIYGATELVPAAAGYDIPGPAGRLLLYGDANDPFNIFAYGAGDGKQNEIFNLQVVMWLLDEPLQKKTIAEARSDPEGDDTPVNLHKLVWVEGFVTASYGEFFDVLYVQDDTGGITVFAPAGTASGAVEAMPVRGDCVRVVGTVDVYQGDTEIQFFESEQVQVLTPTCVLSPALAVTGSIPLPLRTVSATLEAYEGWLAVVTGTVTAVSADRSAIWVDDGSGPVRAFLDGYNGTWSDISPMDRVAVAGLVSEDTDGPRLRVRNYRMHPDRPDDLMLLAPARRLYLPVVLRAARP